MSTKPPDSTPLEEKLSQFEEKIVKLERENKGIKGQMGLMRSEMGLGKPKATLAKPESSAAEPSASQPEATIKPTEAVSSPSEAKAPEFLRPYEHFCADCGAVNPNYVKPNLVCKHCGVPQGTVRLDKQGFEEDTKRIKQCWNCGGQDSKLVGV